MECIRVKIWGASNVVTHLTVYVPRKLALGYKYNIFYWHVPAVESAGDDLFSMFKTSLVVWNVFLWQWLCDRRERSRGRPRRIAVPRVSVKCGVFYSPSSSFLPRREFVSRTSMGSSVKSSLLVFLFTVIDFQFKKKKEKRHHAHLATQEGRKISNSWKKKKYISSCRSTSPLWIQC